MARRRWRVQRVFAREIGSGCYASECDRVSAVCRFVWRGTAVQAVGDGLRQDEEEEEEEETMCGVTMGAVQYCECLLGVLYRRK